MSFIQLSDVSLSFGAQQVLSGCSATMYKGERTALVGPNGCGKTTLLKILAGMAAPDSGTCYHPPGSTVYYLPQSGISHSGKSLYAEAETAFQPLHAQEAKMRELEVRMAKLTSSDSSTEKLVEQHHTIQEKLLEQGYYQRDEYIHRVLTGLGFSEKDFECRTDQFSGGWQMRIALAKALLTHPDILLLDEPTNYLDIEARTWLEDFFGSYSGGLMVVSHDRYFLDVTVNKVAELFQGMLRVYNGNYSAYKEVREKELEALYAAYEKQQAEIAKHEDFIRRFRYNASKASLVQSRVKLLEKLERIQIPENMKTMHFHFPPAPRSGKIPVALEGLSKSYGAKHVLSELNFELERGEKVVIAGVNGAGKTTLSRIVAGADCDYEGTVKYTSGVKIGYFAQNQEEHLDPEKTVLETAEEDCPTELFGQLKNLLGAFLFRGDDVEKKVGVLSGGEKSRLALLKLLLEPVNLLILDEPTNHLDMTSKDVLLESLKSFTGTVLFVSHDRYFIQELATAVLELRPENSHRFFPGDYEYYLYRIAQEAEAKQAQEARTPESNAPEQTDNQLQRQDMKKKKAELKRCEKREAELLEELEELDEKLETLNHELALPEVYSDGEKVKEIQASIRGCEERQAVLHEEWEETETRISALKEQVVT